MRFSMSLGRDDPAPFAPPESRQPDSGSLSPAEAAAIEVRLLEAQLERMRGMLFGYSSLFFATIRNWTFLSIGLLVLGWSGVLPAAVVPVPFVVPFAFLETGYIFWYTVFARRHAERLEQAINERLGREVLVAHRLEAAYFYPPDAPKIAALSFGNPLGMMSAMTIGYSAGAGLLWLAGLLSTNAFIHDTMSPGFPAEPGGDDRRSPRDRLDPRHRRVPRLDVPAPARRGALPRGPARRLSTARARRRIPRPSPSADALPPAAADPAEPPANRPRLPEDR